ncbi:unnamed protein product [Cercopithifilaria johnstoni]|uniref:Uncharacterized protein n=1 Tax=Cercopithifilaria johnstoni TaxID=2874296 RepID=A0A8J2LY57_9BILA|nr:unnamed protein product [Cercopithifilaria johnstoni]
MIIFAALRNVYYLGLVMIVISTFFLSIERAIATLLYQTYERSTRRWISISMALSQITNIQLTVIAIQISSFVIIIVLWTHNNKKLLQRKSQNETVSIRYQLRENVSTSKLLVPLGTIVTILVLTGALLHVLLPSRQTDNYWTNVDQFITYCFYAEIQVCFLPIASIILAIILCYTNQTIRSSLFHLLGLECCTKYSEQNLINISRDEFIRRAYFDQLQQQWNDLPSWNS